MAEGDSSQLTRKGPCSVSSPSRELQPGPPLSQSTTGLFLGSFCDSTNLGKIGQDWCESPSCLGSLEFARPVIMPSQAPVVEVLGVRCSEVAGVLPKRGLLGQAGKAIDFILVRSCFVPGRPGQEQQHEQWRQYGSGHLQEEASVEDVYQSPRSLALRCSSSWGEDGAHLRGKPPPGSNSEPQNLVCCSPVWASPYLCFLASLLSRRRLWTGSHV